MFYHKINAYGVQNKKVDLSTIGWVGCSGRGKSTKIKIKNMLLKCVLCQYRDILMEHSDTFMQLCAQRTCVWLMDQKNVDESTFFLTLPLVTI